MSTIVAIADSVVASLNAGTFSMSFTAERHFQPSFGLADLEELRVSVVPRAAAITSASRKQSQYDCSIDIGIQQRLQPSEPSHEQGQIAALLDFVEELVDHLRFARLTDFPDAAWAGIEHEPVVSTEHLDQHRQFTSILTVNYRVLR
jgi:hypothetical protein